MMTTTMNTNNIILLLLNKTSYQLRTKQKNQFYIYEALIRAASSSKQQKNERLYSSTVWCLDRLIIYPGQRTLLRQHENMLLSSTRRLYPLNFLSSSNSSSNLSSKSQPPDEQSISDHDKTISNNTTIDEPNSVVVVDDEESLKIDRSIYTEQITVRMPDINEGINKVIKWYKKEGDIIKYEDVLCDIETPDFTFGMETDDEHLAIMGKILVKAPSGPIKANEVICILLHPSSSPSTLATEESTISISDPVEMTNNKQS